MDDILGPKRIIEVGDARKNIKHLSKRYDKNGTIGKELPPLPKNREDKAQNTLYSEKARFTNLKIKEIEPPFENRTGQRYPQQGPQYPLKPL